MRRKGAFKEMSERRVALLLRVQKELKERLTAVAKREHRSLNQQIEFLLEQALTAVGEKPRNDE
jgi:hypothetical protein